MPAVLVSTGSGPSIPLDKPVLLLGRQEECDIVLDSRKVSRKHCCLAVINGTVIIRDLASTNGIAVNGKRVTHATLTPGDIVSIGGHAFRLNLAANPPAGASAAPATGLQGTIQLDFPADILSQEDFDSSPLHSAPVSRDRIPQPESSRATPAPKAPSSPSIGTASDQFRGKVIIPDGGIDLNQIESLEDLEAQQGEA